MDWNEMIAEAADTWLDTWPDRDAFEHAHREEIERSEVVQTHFAPEAIRDVTWNEFVVLFRGFDNVRAGGGRVLKIFGANDEDRLRKTISYVLHDRAPIEERLARASGRQLGEGFLTELLCYYRPYQWPVKSLRTARGLARVCRIYQTSEMAELAYDQFRRFLLPILEAFRARLETRWPDAGEFFEAWRFLILCRWLTDVGQPSARRVREKG
jgi:hypothetical protein